MWVRSLVVQVCDRLVSWDYRRDWQGCLGPQDAVTREQMAVFLTRALGEVLLMDTVDDKPIHGCAL